jgi:hypothetical protein
MKNGARLGHIAKGAPAIREELCPPLQTGKTAIYASVHESRCSLVFQTYSLPIRVHSRRPQMRNPRNAPSAARGLNK